MGAGVDAAGAARARGGARDRRAHVDPATRRTQQENERNTSQASAGAGRSATSVRLGRGEVGRLRRCLARGEAVGGWGRRRCALGGWAWGACGVRCASLRGVVMWPGWSGSGAGAGCCVGRVVLRWLWAPFCGVVVVAWWGRGGTGGLVFSMRGCVPYRRLLGFGLLALSRGPDNRGDEMTEGQEATARADARGEFNGWPNYSTWAAHLWLSNDEGLYHQAREAARTASVNLWPGGVFRKAAEALLREYADAVDGIEGEFPDDLDPARVDWTRVYEAFAPEPTPCRSCGDDTGDEDEAYCDQDCTREHAAKLCEEVAELRAQQSRAQVIVGALIQGSREGLRDDVPASVLAELEELREALGEVSA